jgi:hypothetical protein
LKRELTISRFSIAIVLLALIRSIGEVFRLHYTSPEIFSYQLIKPFLIAAFICSVSVFIMVLLSFYRKSSFIIAIAILTIMLMFAIKFLYL